MSKVRSRVLPRERFYAINCPLGGIRDMNSEPGTAHPSAMVADDAAETTELATTASFPARPGRLG